MTLVNEVQSAADLQAKALSADLDAWRERTTPHADSDLPALVRHHSQVARVSNALEAQLKALLAQFASIDDPTRRARSSRRVVHTGAVIWEFFRSKLLLREMPDDLPLLTLLDDVAWIAWKSACLHAKSAAGSGKTPPLVFFSPMQTPFVQTRGSVFALNDINSTSSKDYAELIGALPVPVIGLPFGDARHLPTALSIGHEVGHVLEEDLELEEEIREIIFGVETAEPTAWASWASELFADVWGIHTSGESYVRVLSQYLMNRTETIVQSEAKGPKWGAYPTPMLRMRFCWSVLHALGLRSENARGTWEGMYGTEHAMAHWNGDAEAVAKAMVAGPWEALAVGALTHDDLKPWTSDHETEALKAAADILQDGADPPKDIDARVLSVACALAWLDEPDGYAEQDPDALLADYAENQKNAGTRGEGGDPDEPDDMKDGDMKRVMDAIAKMDMSDW